MVRRYPVAGGQDAVEMAPGADAEPGEHAAELALGGAWADEKPGADLLSEPAWGSGSPVVAAAGAAGHSGQALVLGTACLRGAGDYLVAMLVSSCVVRGGELILEASVKMAGKLARGGQPGHGVKAETGVRHQVARFGGLPGSPACRFAVVPAGGRRQCQRHGYG